MRCRSSLAALLALASAGLPARAAEASPSEPRRVPQLSDHDQAHAALRRGEIKSLDDILEAVKLAPGDSFVEIDLDRSDGRWIYELTVLTASGRYRVVTFDAASAEIIKEEFR